MAHQTVLPKETLDCASIAPGDIVFEGTGGEGGLSREIVSKLGPDGTLIITELDRSLVANLRKIVVETSCRVHVIQDNFRNIGSIVSSLGYEKVDVIILDLGVASYHFEESGRGFTFMKSEPLLMTLDDSPTSGITARDAVNLWSYETLSEIFHVFGGERQSKAIAKAIVKAREQKSIETTADLVAIIDTVYKGNKGKNHPATKVFQALRISVNDELGALKQVLRDGWNVLVEGGRFVVISFHEIEDREVKQWFKSLAVEKLGELITKKAIKPSQEELGTNRRARSARLRAIKKLTSKVS